MHGQTLHLGDSFLCVKHCAIGEFTIDAMTGNVEPSRCSKAAGLVEHSTNYQSLCEINGSGDERIRRLERDFTDLLTLLPLRSQVNGREPPRTNHFYYESVY